MRNRTGSFLWNRSVRADWIKRNVILLVIFMTIYVLNRHFKAYIDWKFIGYICRCHLNDYLGGAVFCIYLNMVLVLGRHRPILDLRVLLLVMFGVSLLWEYFFPIFLSYSTSDIFDVCAYMLGTLTYYALTYRITRKTDSTK